jgi:hypothetical protein
VCIEVCPGIDEFAAVVHPRDGHPKVFAMIDAYLDESGIHSGAKVCVIAGFFGEQEPMRRLETAWIQTLNNFNFPMADFHAKNLLPKRQHEMMLWELSKVIDRERQVYPISQAIIIDDFFSYSLESRRWMTGGRMSKGGIWREGGCPDKPYFVPFQNCLKYITDQTPVGGRVHFAFGLDRTFSGYALTLFKQIHKQIESGEYPSEWASKDRLGQPVFPLATETPQLQAADFFVHLSYQRVLEHYPARDWEETDVSGMLLNCIRNTRIPNHHGIQGKRELEEMHRMALERAARMKEQ